MAPEVVRREPYSSSVDVWGCGVILFILLSGSFPFYGTGEKIFEVIEKGKFTMKSKQWDIISEQAKDLVMCMLDKDPKGRITADAALHHPWLRNKDQCAQRIHLQDSVDELKKFNARRRLKGEVMAAVARKQLGDDSVDQISDVSEDQSELALDVMDMEELSDSAAVSQLIDALEEIQILVDGQSEDIQFLQNLFESSQLQSLLEVHNKVSSVNESKIVESLEPSGVESANEITSAFKLLDTPDKDCDELQELLADPHIMAVLGGHDQTIREIQSGGDISHITGNPTELTDSIADNLTRVRLVQFTKSNNEPMGITLKLNEDGRVIVARIIHGGMIHRQGTLHVADEIREINGISVANHSIENLQANLREAVGDVTFKIVPSLRNNDIESKEVFIRALFDYDPRGDTFIPCQQAGVSFTCGEILQVVSKSDSHWWQAIKAGDKQTAGLIPSPELQELRIASTAVDKAKKDGSIRCLWPGKKKKKNKDNKYVARHNAIFDQLDLVTYEEVNYVKSFKRRTLVLIGAHGVGRRQIKNTLINKYPGKYAYPLPYTSRTPKENEEYGLQYYFVPQESMMTDVAANQFLEYGTHEGAMYGTKLNTIRDVINQGKSAILDVEPPALKLLRCPEFSPYIVFIAAPTNLPQSGDIAMDESLQRLVAESELLRKQHGHYFDLIIVNRNIDDTIQELIDALDDLETKPQWVPAGWVY